MQSKKSIILQNEQIEYNLLQSARARHLRITIHSGGELSVTLPNGMNISKLEDFIRQKADWILRKIRLAKKRKPGLSLPKSSRKDYLKYKEQARALARRKLDEFCRPYNLQYNRISIRNQKSRWGSCSQKGNLNFSYRIVYLPEEYLNYIIVHELCHLKELNHSKNFWDLVAQSIPNYKIVRKNMRLL
jgi:predicted metal-dependent hydrolase